MLSTERHELILKELALRGSLRVAEFAKRVGSSGMTVRRDLDELAAKGALERVHGGAVPVLAASANRTSPTPWTPRSQVATIGMLVPSAGYYFPGIIRGAESAAAKLGVRLVLAVSEYSEVEECRQVKRLLNIGVQGLLVTPSAELLEGQEVTRLLSSAKVPVVIVERSIDEVLDEGHLEAVRSDHIRGAEIAVNHLVSLGHKNIALFTHEGSPTSSGINKGFRRALARNDLPISDAVIREIPRMHGDSDAHHEMVLALVNSCRDGAVTAAIIHNDQYAIQFTNIAQECGLSVPENFSVIAYDDEVASLGDVALTAVAPPKFDVGFQAVMTCFNRISGPVGQSTLALQRVNLSPMLTVRESTAAVRR